jgi:aminoglycoside N3'-acetyltransferase
MYKKQDLVKHLKELGINENGTLLINSENLTITQGMSLNKNEKYLFLPQGVLNDEITTYFCMHQ